MNNLPLYISAAHGVRHCSCNITPIDPYDRTMLIYSLFLILFIFIFGEIVNEIIRCIIDYFTRKEKK